MNDDTILALGGFCKELLSDERFSALTSLYSQQCATDILNTQAHEAKAREGIYSAYQGFENFLGLTKKFAEAFNQINEQKHAAVTTDDQIDDPGVHDIYGNDLN